MHMVACTCFWLPEYLSCAWHSNVWLLVSKAKGVRLSARAPGRACRGKSPSKRARVSACQPAEAQGVPVILIALCYPSAYLYIYQPAVQALIALRSKSLAATRTKAVPRLLAANHPVEPQLSVRAPRYWLVSQKPAKGALGRVKGSCLCLPDQLARRPASLATSQQSELVALKAMPAGSAHPSFRASGRLWQPPHQGLRCRKAFLHSGLVSK